MYFLLAGFDVITVCLALFLSHQLMGIHTQSVAMNAEWVARLNDFSKLASLAADVNAPGNDIFDSHDIPLETGRLQRASGDFDAQLAAVRGELRANVAEPARTQLAKSLTDVETAMERMSAEASTIFDLFRQQQPEAAGARMASMDRTYYQLNQRIEALRSQVTWIQGDLLDRQLEEAEQLRDYEFLLGGLVLLMIAAAVSYGRRMARQGEQQASERERRLLELQEAQRDLAAAHDELEHRVQLRTVELDSFFELALEMLSIASSDGRFLRLNPAWEAVLGHTREELMSRPFLEFVHPDDVSLTVDVMQGLDEGRGVVAFENRLCCKDGSYKWLSWQAAPAPDNALVYATARDITHQREVQHALEAQATSLAEAQKIGRLGNWEWDIERDNVRWSDQMYRVFGIKPADFTPTVAGFMRLVHPDDRDRVQAVVQGCMDAGTPVDFEHRTLLPDGSVRHVHARNRLVKNAAGQPMRMFGTAQDVTERVRAEEALRASEERYRLVSRATHDVIWDWDLETGLISYNRVYSDGFDPATDTCRPHAAARPMANVHPDDAPRIKASIDEWLAGQADVWTGEYRMHLSNGSYAQVLDRAMVQRDPSGRVTRVVGTMMDISEQKKLEQDLRQAKDEAERASSAKSDFLANMSHEIRTPMNGVLGTLGLLQDSALDPSQRELTGIARASGEALLALINDILDFSKIEAGKLSLAPIPFDLLRACEGIADMMATLAAGKGLDLILRYAPDVPRHVIGDPGRIRQVLTNLISNAIKFTDKGQVLVDVEADAQDDQAVCLRIRVEDTGPGIISSQLKTIFDKFTQADASTTRRHGGTGLGLAISSQLVELMGGTIGVDSNPGQGSTFWFSIRLPLQQDAPPASLPPADLAGVRVLIVDDNPVNRRVLHEQVIGWKMRNGSSATAEEAMRLLRTAHAAGDPYKIAILDYQMPGADGAMLGRAIKEDPDLRDISLIMLTSMGQRGDVARLKAIGFAAYLVKPTRQSDLLHALATVWSARVHKQDPGMVTRHTLVEERTSREVESTRRTFNAHVLLAEDHPTNRIVASMMLRNLGCSVDVAANGREAIQMLQDAEYDLVFMDCEMPIMDGFEATAEIRLRADANTRIPIIAVTAQAMQGDRERCLRAGMDDYISKPVQSSAFAAALQQWTPQCAMPVMAVDSPDVEAEPGVDNAAATAAALDADVMARLRALAIATDRSLLGQIFASFQRDGAARIVALHDAAKDADAMALHTVAHAMKGASVNIGALTLAELAAQLEAAGDTGSLASVASLLTRLEFEFARVVREIDAIDADVAHVGGEQA